nr:hypothetical protein Itr_chr06CG09180 [Ipomoea trifida]
MVNSIDSRKSTNVQSSRLLDCVRIQRRKRETTSNLIAYMFSLLIVS